MTDEIEGLTEGLGEKEARLFEYCEQQPEIKKILEEFQVPRENFEKLYNELASVGALQSASGHLIAASALAYPSTLRYLLNNWQIDLEHNIIMGDGSKQRMAYSLIMYFKRGEALD